jgi:phage terminase large subunit
MLATTLQNLPNPVAQRRLVDTARQSGLPADQLRAFLRAGYVPQAKQMPFHAAARACDLPGGPTYLGQGGARGGAKSHGAICQVVHDDCQRVPGLKWLYLRNVGASARESFGDMLGKAMPGLMRYYVSQRSALELPNGSRVLLGGFRNENDVDKYIGIEYDGLLIDDGHLISKTKFDKILGSLRTSKPGWRPRGYITFNPGGVGHAYLKQMFVMPWRRKRETTTRFFFSLPEDNAFLNPEYIAYLNGLSGWLYKAWRKGDFDIAAGQFFTNWSSDVHVVRPVTHIPRDWRVWLALDYGFTHYTTVYLFAQSGDGMIYILDEHAERKWLVPQHAEAIRAMLQRNGIEKHRLETFVAGGDVFAKEADGNTVEARYAKEGFELTMANTARIDGAAEILARLGDPERGISPRLVITERCARLIECLPSLEHDPHRPEDVLKVDTDDEGNGGDDSYDGARYGVMVAAGRAGSFVMNYRK